MACVVDIEKIFTQNLNRFLWNDTIFQWCDFLASNLDVQLQVITKLAHIKLMKLVTIIKISEESLTFTFNYS